MWREMRRVASLLIWVASVGRVFGLNSNLPPSGNFDLSHWYLQLPTSNGILTGASGTVDTSSTSQLTNGFTNAYFYTGGDGAMVFWCPDDGATTSGSTHPRSELRELLNPNDNSLNWTPFGVHTLTATCVVSNVSSDTLKVCIGQIHEDAGAGVPMVMIMYYNNTIYADYWPDGNNNSSSSWHYGSFTIGSMINYQMTVSNGLLSVAVNNKTNTFNLFTSGANWQSNANAVYFKAGDYSQTTNKCNCSTDGARVAFYSLRHSHTPSITNQPAGISTIMGASATFNVGAIGNGTLSYQWWLNGTAQLRNATNPTLVLTNLALTNAGNYTVVITDSTPGFGSVTSAIASLTAKPLKFGTTTSTNGIPHITFSGAPSNNYVLQATTNLFPPNWQTVATNLTDGNGNSVFIDSNAAFLTRRFYRLRTP